MKQTGSKIRLPAVPPLVDPENPRAHERGLSQLQRCIDALQERVDRLRAQEILPPLRALLDVDARVEALTCTVEDELDCGHVLNVSVCVRRKDGGLEEGVDTAWVPLDGRLLPADTVAKLQTHQQEASNALSGWPTKRVLDLVNAHLANRQLTRSDFPRVHRDLAGPDIYDPWAAARQAERLARTAGESRGDSGSPNKRPRM